MTLKELRISKKLTQIDVAKIMRMSIRSYKQYENEESKKDTIKYKYIFNELSNIGYIDEEHGLLDIESIKTTVTKILENKDVSFCYLFGSYARGEASDKSDVDLLISTPITGMDFYGLAEELREGLLKKVDLLNLDQLNNNPQLIREILKDGIKIYG